VNFSRKLRNAGDAARPAMRRRPTGRFSRVGIVDFSPDRVVMPGPEDRPFPPGSPSRARSGDANYSRWVRVDASFTTPHPLAAR